MTTIVSVDVYTYTVAHITDKMLRSVLTIVRECGLDPSKLAGQWDVIDRGLRTWLTTRDLSAVVLEVWDPSDDSLVGRWDFDLAYAGDGDGDLGRWVDTDAIRAAIRKAGVWPSTCEYRIVASTRPGRPNVAGWATTTLRSTDGFVRQSIGTTISGPGAEAGTAYWRRR